MYRFGYPGLGPFIQFLGLSLEVENYSYSFAIPVMPRLTNTYSIKNSVAAGIPGFEPMLDSDINGIRKFPTPEFPVYDGR